MPKRLDKTVSLSMKTRQIERKMNHKKIGVIVSRLDKIAPTLTSGVVIVALSLSLLVETVRKIVLIACLKQPEPVPVRKQNEPTEPSRLTERMTDPAM